MHNSAVLASRAWVCALIFDVRTVIPPSRPLFVPTGVAHDMSHSAACTLWGLAAYLVSLLLCLPAVASLLPAAVGAHSVSTALLAVTYVLVGLPQLVESVCLAAAGQIDTHVLMALAAFGTLYLGMPQEVWLLCTCD
jgi:hypothetical protein